MKQKNFLFLFLIIGLIFPSSVYGQMSVEPPTVNIPPTNAFDKIHSDNGTINAVNFSMPFTVAGGSHISVTSNNKTHTLTVSGVGIGSTSGTYNTTQANNVNINTGGTKINFLNQTSGQVFVVNSPGKGQVNVTIATGSSGVTSLNALSGALTIACVVGNTTCTTSGGNTITINTAWNIATLTQSETFTALTIFNNARLGGNLDLNNHQTQSLGHIYTEQNNTGTHCLTNQTGICGGANPGSGNSPDLTYWSGSNILGSFANIFIDTVNKALTPNVDLGANLGTNSTRFNHVTAAYVNASQQVTQAGNKVFDTINAGTGISSSSTHGGSTTISNTGVTSVSATAPITTTGSTGSITLACPTCATGISGSGKVNRLAMWNATSTINDTKGMKYDRPNQNLQGESDLGLNIGSNSTRIDHVNAKYLNASDTVTQNGNKVIDTITAGRNINAYKSGGTVNLSANNTAYPRNIYSNGGVAGTGGSGQPYYINNTNTTLFNIRTMLSLNNFAQLETNKTNVIINASVPASNVVDVYDTTIGDYSTPSGATASSVSSPTNNTVIFSNGQVAASWAVGTMQVGKITGLTTNTEYNEVVFKVKTAAGNIRAKVYQDDGTGGLPSTLLGESASTPVVGATSASLYVPLISSFKVPASGKVWVGFEVDSAGSVFLGNNSGVILKQQTHTYGSGPNPFGTPSGSVSNQGEQMRLVNNQTAANTIDGNTGSYWTSNVEANPNIYIDTGSAQVLSGLAIYWNGTSTATQLLLQTSTDHVTWNTKRTVNTSLLTDKAWNFIRWDMDSALQRYIRIYGNDGTNKQLSIYELKALIPSTTVLIMRHGHEFIDSTNATLPLNR